MPFLFFICIKLLYSWALNNHLTKDDIPYYCLQLQKCGAGMVNEKSSQYWVCGRWKSKHVWVKACVKVSVVVLSSVSDVGARALARVCVSISVNGTFTYGWFGTYATVTSPSLVHWAHLGSFHVPYTYVIVKFLYWELLNHAPSSMRVASSPVKNHRLSANKSYQSNVYKGLLWKALWTQSFKFHKLSYQMSVSTDGVQSVVWFVHPLGFKSRF